MARTPGFRRLTAAAALFVLAACSDRAETPVAPQFHRGGDDRAERDAQLDDELLELLEAQGGLEAFRLPRSHQLGRIPQDPNNPLTGAKVRLGQLLYHETALAGNNVRPEGEQAFSCASCHFAQAGFQANLPQGIAEGGTGFGDAGEERVFDAAVYDPTEPDVQPIRTPTAMNGAYQELMLWNGQFGGVGANLDHQDRWTPGTPLESNTLGLHGLETQAHAGLEVHRMGDVELSAIAEMPRYRAAFRKAFPGDGQVNRLNAALAIAAFERTVLANRAPWQDWLRGKEKAMSREEKEGAILFFGEAGCSGCHSGPALNSMSFHALGMPDIDASVDPSRVNLAPFGGAVPAGVARGRGGFTGEPADDFTFKTPQLYNLTDSPFYGHGGSFSSVRDVVAYKNTGVPAKAVPTLSPAFVPLGLDDDEVDALTAFLENALHDDRLMRYVPRRLPSGNCTPVNDALAREDLECR